MPAQKTFKSLGRRHYQCPQCASVCQVRKILFENQTKSFFLSFGQGVYFFEESAKSIQDIIGDVYCPGKYCSNREKYESLGSYVAGPWSIYVCWKCAAWLFVHKVPFMLQVHVKTTKTDKSRFFFAKKRWIWHPTNNCCLMSHFYQPNIEGKICVRTTKHKRLLEKCVVQHVEMKSVFTFQPIKRINSMTVKKCKAWSHVLIIPFKDQKPTFCCLAVMVHFVLQERQVVISKKKNHLHFWKTFSANYNQAHPDVN